MEFDVEIMENPSESILELDKKIKDGKAFLVWATGISKKREKKLEKIAMAGLKGKKKPVNLHIVSDGVIEFRILE